MTLIPEGLISPTVACVLFLLDGSLMYGAMGMAVRCYNADKDGGSHCVRPPSDDICVCNVYATAGSFYLDANADQTQEPHTNRAKMQAKHESENSELHKSRAGLWEPQFRCDKKRVNIGLSANRCHFLAEKSSNVQEWISGISPARSSL